MTRSQKSGLLRPILHFATMDIVGMDFVRPINSPGEAMGAIYIFLVVDYFCRFVFGGALKKVDQSSTMQFLLDKVVTIVPLPKSVYSVNGSHFTGNIIKQMWKDDGVLHFTSAILQPQSVGLSERYVQMVTGCIFLKCIAIGSSKNWSLYVMDPLLDVNTRCVRIHGYTPSEILLGLNPAMSRSSVVGQPDESPTGQGNWTRSDKIPMPEEDTIHVHIYRQDEHGWLASEKLACSQERLCSRSSPGYRIPKVGDLVLVRDIQLAKEKGKKLEPRWSTPRLLERLFK